MLGYLSIVKHLKYVFDTKKLQGSRKAWGIKEKSMKRRIKGERKAYREIHKERKRRLQPYKPQVKARRNGGYRWLKPGLLILLGLAVLGIGMILGINAYVKHKVANRLLSTESAAELSDVDCILVLGCLVKDSGELSHMLEDRLRRAVELYRAGAATKLLMSGDHGRKEYNEVEAMKQYAIEQGIASKDVFMDHAGFSTYESCYRAGEIFEADKIIIVTQEYHLYRALYIAEELGLDAYGVSSDYRTYYNQKARDVREVLARVKDFFYVLFRPEPTYLGGKIPISGNGDVTND